GGGRGLAATLTSTAGGSTIFGGRTGGTGTTLTDRGGGGGGAGMGAGIFSNAGTLNVVNSTFNGNVALGGSGGAGNVAGANGGGGQGLGGGIFVLDGTTRIVGCTFANCGAPQGGAAVYIRGEGGAANVTFENSIAADRGAGPTEVAASSNGTPGSVVANGSGNVIEASAGVPALVATTVDPALGALASNGGPTQTHALGSTSSAKAIGVAATCAAAFPTGSGGVDQRGAPRTSCDAGAYEAGTGTIVILSGTPQSALIGQAFATALRVRVLDGAGAPQVGVAVTFGVPGSGASATIATSPATTNAAGEATVTATANATAGVYSVIASVPSGANAVFTLTNLAVILEKVSGDSQAATLNMDFALPLVVRVRNASGTPLAGQTVTFSAPGGGASATFAPTTVVTDASGLASTTATANGTGGDFNATASTSGAVVTFSLTNRGRGGTDSILRTRRIVIKGKDCALAPGDTGPGSALWLLALAGLLLGLRRRS
ncbi:MAG: Ig-like domain-containing protein, partial [Planctomycetes bacterium]|nr:Ig-like domain-containing protein [Planctomycetota bacterium]